MVRNKQLPSRPRDHDSVKFKPDLSMLTLPRQPTEEGSMLYRQYYFRFGMTPELRSHITTVLGWSKEQVSTHVRHMSRSWIERSQLNREKTGESGRQ